MHRPNRSNESSARCHAGGDRGSAALEFILVGLVLLVPVAYLVVALGLLQAQSLGAEAASRHVARSVSTAANPAEAEARADRIVSSVIAEYGLDADAVTVELACRPAGGACPRAGVTLHVTIRTTATLPLVPPVLGLDRMARIPIEASALQKVSRFWGTR